MTTQPQLPNELDARSIGPETLEQLRRQVIAAWKAGSSRRRISVEVGLSYSAVVKIINRYAEFGEASFAVRKRGTKPGMGRLLTSAQEQIVLFSIDTMQPRQLGLPYRRWSCPAVRQFIQGTLGVRLTERTVWNYMSRWGSYPRRLAGAANADQDGVSAAAPSSGRAFAESARAA